MPREEDRYFMHLIASDVTKDARFDIKRLSPVPDEAAKDENNINVRIRKEKINYYFRMLCTYDGESIDKITSTIDYKFANKMAKDLVTIVAITRKYKWIIGDFHTGNICSSININSRNFDKTGNIVLIDFDYMVNVLYASEDKLYEFEINYDYYEIVIIMSNIYHYLELVKVPFRPSDETLIKYLKTILLNKNYKQIKRYFIKYTSPFHALSLQNCEKGNYENIKSVIYYLHTFLRVLDLDAWDAFWSANFPEHVSVPLLLRRDRMIKLLDGYYR